jgi:hypothetical protein
MQSQTTVSRKLKRAARRGIVAVSVGILASVVGLGLAVGLQACGSDSESTSGKRVTLHTRVEVNDVVNAPFTSAVGWNVTVTKAAVSAGPFYYFDGAPPLVLRERHDSWQYAARVLGLGTAHAHPGHYQAGNAMGQMLESSSLDLLDGVAEFPDGDGVSGVYRSARFTFSAASGPAKKELDGHVAVAEGMAEKDGEPPRYFRAFADLATIENSAADGHIEGCEFVEADVEGDGTVTINVNPKIWFDLVDFSEAEEASADAPAYFPDGSQPQIAFVLGVTQLSAYKFSFSSP